MCTKTIIYAYVCFIALWGKLGSIQWYIKAVEKKFSLLLVLEKVEKPFLFVLHLFASNQKGAVKNKEHIKQRQMKSTVSTS
jgi:hypothetical protein